MAGLVSNLIISLEGQIDLYNQIIALSAHKKDNIINNDIENLKKIVADENIIVPKIMRADKDREKIMQDICTVLNKKQDELTLRYLVTLVEGQPEYNELKDAVERLGKAAEEMKNINENNKMLLEQALEFVDYNMNMIHSAFAETPAGYEEPMDDVVGRKNLLDIEG